MRFHHLALTAAALLAVGFFPEKHGFAIADEEPTTTSEEEEEKTPAEPYSPPENAETFQFEAEVNRMLDIVVNSLYTNKDVFLRELISNASDALDKIRFLSLTKPELLDDKSELEIRIQYDVDEKTLSIRDSGIGMTHDDLVKNLGTVARSGTTKFLEAMKDGASGDMGGMIGQFGVGFYSTFLVADKVSVASKHPEDGTQHVWECLNGESSFYIAEDPRGNSLGRGTEITLHLKEDAEEYADPEKIKDLVKHYSEFITHPIHLRTTTTTTVEVDEDEDEEDKDEEEKKEEDDLEVKEDEDEDEPSEKEEKPKKTEEVTTHSWEEVNTDPAIWTKDKDSISDDEYQSFWKVVSKESHSNATRWTHFNAEGNINFRSILYLPDEIPSHLRDGHIDEALKGGLKLYVRKVLISDEFNLMPRYMAFIKGVVDSDDLPLNVNRETLQESKIIKVIQKKLVRKVLEMLRKFADETGKKSKDDDDEEEAEVEIDDEGNVIEKEKKEDDDDDDEDATPPYLEWYRKFAPSIKMGAIEDDANRAKVLKLLRFETSKTEGDEMTSLKEYVDRMHDWQDDIYFFAGTSRKDMEKSHFMEMFKDKDVEVIFMTEAVDEYMVQHVREFDGKKFTAITKEGIKFKDEDEDLIKRREKAYKKMFKPLTKWLNKLYGPSVMKVAISKRLGSAPAIMSTSDWGSTANMERIMRAQAFQHGQEDSMYMAQRIFEINPRHPLVHKLLAGCPPEEEEKKKKDDGDDEDSEEVKEDKPPFVVADEVVDAAWMLHDMALLSGGFPIADPKAFTERSMRVMQSQLGVDSLALEEEINPPVDDEEDDAPEIDLDGMEGINMEDFGGM